MMKRIVYIFIVFFLLIISGCTSHNRAEKTVISFSTWGSKSEINTIKSIITKFENENPDIKIKLIHIPDNYFQKLHLLIASDLSPDVIFINNLNAKMYINAGKLEPLDAYIANKKNLYFEKALMPMTYNEKLYIIPRDVSNMVVYYNKDLFDKYKIPYPKDLSREDFLKTANSLTIDNDNDGKIDIFGFGFEKTSIYWLPFLFSDGGGIISDNGKEIILNKKASIDAVQFYADLRNKYHVCPKSQEQASLTTSQLFLQGKIAMHLCGRWCSLTYKKEANFNWGIATFPKGKIGSIVGLDASGYALSSSCKNKKAAWKFIEFISSDNSATSLAKDGLIFPANKNAAYDLKYDISKDALSTYINTLQSSKNTPTIIKYQELNDILSEEFESVFDGKKSANDAINEKLVQKLKKLLD